MEANRYVASAAVVEDAGGHAGNAFPVIRRVSRAVCAPLTLGDGRRCLHDLIAATIVIDA